MDKGLLIIFSGPSGVGKGTVLNLFKDNKNLNLAYSVSMTTREKREGEVEGKNYFFVSKERFDEAIKNDELLEYAMFVDNYYGTPIEYVEKLRNLGKNVILEIEVQGALKAMSKYPDALSIFLIPPSFKELERRIRGRRSEQEDIIVERLKKAEYEMNLSERYDYVVCNDTALNAAEEISSIILEKIKKRKGL